MASGVKGLFHPLEKVDHLIEGYSRCFSIRGEKYLLVHSAETTRLIPVRCPHAGHSLRKGRVQQGVITCPKHGIGFDLSDGRALGGVVFDNVAPLQFMQLEQLGDCVGIRQN